MFNGRPSSLEKDHGFDQSFFIIVKNNRGTEWLLVVLISLSTIPIMGERLVQESHAAHYPQTRGKRIR